jgi:hypothetical protein
VIENIKAGTFIHILLTVTRVIRRHNRKKKPLSCVGGEEAVSIHTLQGNYSVCSVCTEGLMKVGQSGLRRLNQKVIDFVILLAVLQ